MGIVPRKNQALHIYFFAALFQICHHYSPYLLQSLLLANSFSVILGFGNKKKRSDQVLRQHGYCCTCIHSQINSRSSIKQRIVLKSGKPFVQRPDGRRSRHVQQSPLGIEQTRRAISKQRLVPDLLFMNKVIVENRNQEDICDK